MRATEDIKIIDVQFQVGKELYGLRDLYDGESGGGAQHSRDEIQRRIRSVGVAITELLNTKKPVTVFGYYEPKRSTYQRAQSTSDTVRRIKVKLASPKDISMAVVASDRKDGGYTKLVLSRWIENGSGNECHVYLHPLQNSAHVKGLCLRDLTSI